jgi:transcriptional regulator with XRE-family HTH domain
LSEKPKTDWGRLIRAAREGSGLSQDGLARKSGLSVRAIGHYEQGMREPELLSLVQIFLGVNETEQLALARHLPSEVWHLAARLVELAKEHPSLDTSVIILGVLRAESPSPTSSAGRNAGFDRQVALGKEAHSRAKSRKKNRQVDPSRVA